MSNVFDDMQRNLMTHCIIIQPVGIFPCWVKGRFKQICYMVNGQSVFSSISPASAFIFFSTPNSPSKYRTLSWLLQCKRYMYRFFHCCITKYIPIEHFFLQGWPQTNFGGMSTNGVFHACPTQRYAESFEVLCQAAADHLTDSKSYTRRDIQDIFG